MISEFEFDSTGDNRVEINKRNDRQATLTVVVNNKFLTIDIESQDALKFRTLECSQEFGKEVLGLS